MAKETLALQTLNAPPPLNSLLAEDRAVDQDCIPCRVTGAAAFIGLGGYSLWSGHAQLREQKAKILASKSMWGMGARRAGINGIAASLVAVGLYRLFN